MLRSMFNQENKSQEIINAKNTFELNKIISNKLNTQKIEPNKTLILFDLDLTVIDRDGIMSDLYPQERRKFIESMSKINPNLVEAAYSQAPYHLVEIGIVDCINELKNKGLLVLGFTSRRTGKAKIASSTFVEEDACNSLKSLGVNFSKIEDMDFDIDENSIQLENPNLLPYELVGKPKMFGLSFGASTIFTANYPKGLILELLIENLSKQNKEINHVVVIDDNAKYLQNLKEVCEKNNMAFSGLHYTFAHDNKKELNQEVIEYQSNNLIKEGKFINEDIALIELEKLKPFSLTN